MPRLAGRSGLTLPAYAELICRSNFSFLGAASHPEELVARAQALRYSALAVTDECSLAGVVRAHLEAARLGLPLLIGSDFTLQPHAGAATPVHTDPAKPVHASLAKPVQKRLATSTDLGLRAPLPCAVGVSVAADPEADPEDEGAHAEDRLGSAPPPQQHSTGPRLVMLAMSRRGYGNLAQWISVCRRRAPKGQYRAEMADLEGRVPAAPMLAGLPGCLALLVVSCPLPPADPFETLFAHALWLKTWFGDRAALALPLLMTPHDTLLVELTQRVAALTGLPVVAVGDVRMHARSRKPLLDVLTATRLRCTVAAGGHALAANAEAHLRSRARLARLYRREWLDNTLVLAGRCAFSLAELKYEYPREIVPVGHTPASWLRVLTEEGAARRYPAGVPAPVRAMLEHELALITQLQYEAYFLTVADIVHWARRQGILCQGRGSAANSAVCYCLEVTAVDPEVHTMLLFERFISAERNEPPDIDIDFEHQRREEVIQYIYRKYGRHRAALTGVVISYRPRSALRDVGRALGIDLDRIEAVSKSQHWFDGRKIDPERLRENGFDPETHLTRLWLELTQQLIGFPRHLSQHPGGFVIARDTLAELVPVENASMPGRSVIQWDKDDLDALRLIKVDILALGMLSAIRRALDMVGQKQGAPIALHQIPKEDAASYAMLCRGDSVGTFQVESRAQMAMLPRLRPQAFYDLVIEVAIVRPGPIQGGMVHPYLRRRNGEEPVDYPSAEVEKALSRTLGVPIFQEQVMQLAILAADFTPGEADQLRRAMAAWKRKGGLGPFHARLVGRMVEKGYELEYAERIFKQIEGFGEYGFPESHAASFALLVYASAWLKCHHPDAFLAALLNSQPMGFYAPAQLVRDARDHGVQVLPVDVLRSQWESVLEEDASAQADIAQRCQGAAGAGRSHTVLEAAGDSTLGPVRLGFSRISGLAQDAAERVVAARAEAPFASPEDLARRARLDAHQLALLADADALRALAGHRHQAAWSVAGVDTRATTLLQGTRTHEVDAALPAPDAAATVLADYRRLGLSLTQHPVALLRTQLAAFKVLPADVLQHFPHGRLARASGIVTHRQRPETAKGVVFVTLEDDTGAVNVIVWPQVAEKHRRALLGSSLLTVYGIWQCQGEPGHEVRHLVARTLVDHTALLQGLAPASRNFR
ncbi:MAG: error-prone DNA polymerase [Rubrivivax sp.]|nr:error-prone DNA polymerase [Rubrivivax sp.]